MSNYVESGYSENYVEGDTPPTVVGCDLTIIRNELGSLRAENSQLKDSILVLQNTLDSLVSSISNLNTLTLSNQNKLVDLESKIDLIPTSDIDISNLVTTDYIDNKVPFVDDKSLRIFPQGTEVIVGGLDGSYIVESSRFLPNGDWDYTVVYTVSREIDGKKYFSDFAASYLRLLDLDVWMLKSECPENSE